MLAVFKETGKKNKGNYDLRLWQQHSHPIKFSSNEMMNQRLDNLYNILVKSRYVIHLNVDCGVMEWIIVVQEKVK